MNIKWWRIFLHAISFGHLEIVQYASNAIFEYKDGKKNIFSVRFKSASWNMLKGFVLNTVTCALSFSFNLHFCFQTSQFDYKYYGMVDFWSVADDIKVTRG